MNLYDQLKTHLTPRCVTERYGPPIHRGDMICCPFHDDKTPSMKLYDDHFYCFGCQKSGDRRCDRPCGTVPQADKPRSC